MQEDGENSFEFKWQFRAGNYRMAKFKLEVIKILQNIYFVSSRHH